MLHSFLRLVFILSAAVAHCQEREPRITLETDLILIRHGETDWNREKKVQGFTDKPLNAAGIHQAENLAEKMWVHHPDICKTIYSSDLSRAMQTAKKVAEKFNSEGVHIKSLEIKKDLREHNCGIIEGMSIHEKNRRFKKYTETLTKQYPLRKKRWQHPPAPVEGVETLNHLLTRTKKALYEIAEAHPGEKVAVFVHGKLINTLIIDTENMETDQISSQPNCVLVHFHYSSGNPHHPLQLVKIENLLEYK